MMSFNPAKEWLRDVRKDGESITLHWVTQVNPTIDETTGSKIGAVTAASEVVKGFVHFPEIAKARISVWAQFEEGDCIVDIPPDTTLEGRDQLKFEINGQLWEQAKTGERGYVKHWEVAFGVKVYRSVHLRKQV